MGNDFFMSLGNIVATGGVALLFTDYESGAAVTVDGHARCVLVLRYCLHRCVFMLCRESLSACIC